MGKKYFLSFVEEMIFNREYESYRGGRIEVFECVEGEMADWACEEIRFFTKNQDSFLRFRDKWDFAEVSEEELEYIKKVVKKNFYEDEEV